MTFRQLEAMKRWFRKQSEITRIIIIYRFVSLLITSIFYFTNQFDYSLEKRLTVIICIAGSAILLNYLYIKNRGHHKNILLLILMETCGNSILLIPSGGINSPYVWYSLNTILIASVELPGKYCWLNLTVYLVISLFLSAFIQVSDLAGIAYPTNSESNLILSLVLITAVIRLLSKYAIDIQNSGSKLTDANERLKYANKKIIESFNHIMELYQAVNLFSCQKRQDDLIKLIVHYTQKITKSQTVFFYNVSESTRRITIQSISKINNLENGLKAKISEAWNEIIDSQMPLKMCVGNRDFSIIFIGTSYMSYGVLGIQTSLHEEGTADKVDAELLSFLARLSAIALERYDLEQVNERLVIAEEQNRIANEIHDNVLQRLFSISCGIYNLSRNLKKSSISSIDQELDLIRNSINSSMNELRSTIYGLSWKKGGIDNFIADITNYINQIKCLNHIDIDFDISGNSEMLLSIQKKAVYRIVCEGISNAIHHGKARKIEVMFHIGQRNSTLEINDNGAGFDVETLEASKQGGLGIRNIKSLVVSLEGEINIQSVVGAGTNIKIIVPNVSRDIKREEIV